MPKFTKEEIESIHQMRALHGLILTVLPPVPTYLALVQVISALALTLSTLAAGFDDPVDEMNRSLDTLGDLARVHIADRVAGRPDKTLEGG